MSVYMDVIAIVGGIAEIGKGERNCAKIEKEEKMRYGLNKTKCAMVKTGKKKEQIVQENSREQREEQYRRKPLSLKHTTT